MKKKYKPVGMTGKTHTEETKKQISASKTGKKRAPFTEEHRKRMANRVSINNGVIEKRIYKENLPEYEEWNIGRLTKGVVRNPYKKRQRFSSI